MKNSLTAVICNLNSKYIHSSLAPWCLLAGVNTYGKSGITVIVVEGTINEKQEDILERIKEHNPQVIGFCCYIWNICMVRRLVKQIKERLPDTVVILGGPEVSYHADAVLKEETAVDYILSGEGEVPFALLLNAIYSGMEVHDIPGVCYRDGESIVVSPPNIAENDPPSPYSDAYFAALKGRIAYLETSRGCPFCCAFCLSGRCGSARFFDLDRAKRELLLLANSGTQTIKLVDRTFNANRGRANEIFRFIIENYGKAIPHGVCFHFEIAGDLLNEETLYLLSEAPAGAMQLEIGLQSFQEKTLTAIHRKTNVERLKKNIERLISHGNMHIHIDLIAGLPYEDLSGFADSFDTAYALKPNMLQLGFLKLLHGAPMRESPEQFPCRYSETPPYEVMETPWLSAEELTLLHRVEDALEHLYNSGRFRRTLHYVLEQTGRTPFELFCFFGCFAAENGAEGISLDEYTALAFNWFSRQSGIDKVVLRDVMVCDRLATNASGKLPVVLRISDSALKDAVKTLDAREETRRKRGIRRGVAILYSERCTVYVDYVNKNPVTGEYPLLKVSL